MVDWVASVTGLVGVALGLGYSYVQRHRDDTQRLRIMTFEKRLQTHQEAYHWCHKLNRVLNSSDVSEIIETSRQARDWWDAHCFSLDEGSRQQMLSLTNYSFVYAQMLGRSGEHVRDQVAYKVWDVLSDTMKSLVAGIGKDHLPDSTKVEGANVEHFESSEAM